MLLTMGMSGFAQSLADYIMTTGTDATKWQTLTTTTNLISSTGDGVASSVTNIGFTFNFGGTDYTQFSVNSDGNLRFGSIVTGTANYSTPFSASNANINNPKINMLGCDGYLTDSGYVHHEVIGTAPNRVCVVEFATSTYNSTSRPSLLRWQVQLFETTNDIQIVYASTTPPILPNVARQPGMCVNSSNIILLNNTHDAMFYSEGQSTTSCPTGTWPNVNRYYLFQLSSCLTPSQFTCTAVSISDMTVSWHNPNTSATIVLQYKPANGTWDDDAVTVYPTDTFYQITNLTDNTVYNVRVHADCGMEQSNWTYLTVHTPCTELTTLPYFQNFDAVAGVTSTSVATSNLPDCWSHINAGTSTSYSGYPIVYNNSSYSQSGTNAMRFYTYTTAGTYDDQMAILPPIDVNVFPMNTLQLNFDARRNSTYTLTLVVGVLSNPTDKTTFVPIDTITNTSDTYVSYEIPFSNYTGTGNYIALMAPRPSSSYNSGYIDNVLVDLIPMCDKPTNVTASNATNSSIDLTWTENGTATSWVVEYGPAGFDLGSGTTETVTSLPFTLSNLNHSTAYDIYVKSDCGTGTDFSGYSNVITAYTLCEMISTLPFEENFDAAHGSSATSAATTNLPYCWNKLNAGTSSSYSGYPIIYTSTTYAQSGANALRFYTYTTSGTYDDQMAILPQFDVNTNPMNTMQISFDARNNSSYTFTLIVGVLTNPADKTTFEPIDTIVTTNGTYTNYVVRFNNYQGTGSYIGLMAKKPTSSYNSGYIDNIVVDLIPSCAPPYNVSATSTGSDTVFVSWNDDLGSQWDVIYGPAGFDPDTSTGTVIEYGFTSTNAAITGLSNGVIYDFYVRTDCGGSTSAWNTIPVTGAPYLYFMGVTGSATLTTCGTIIADDGGPNGDYSNNCNYTLVIYPSDIDSVVSVSGTFDGESTLDYLSVYDGNVVNENNLLQKIVSGTSGNVVNFGPLISETGPITLHFHSDGSIVRPGFLVQTSCVAAPSCPKPHTLHAAVVTNTEATIIWDAVGATNFNVAYSTSATFDPATCPDVATSSTNSYTFNNLTPSTTYYVSVQSDCGSEMSNWSYVMSFRTACNPTTTLPFTENFDSVTGATTTSVSASNLPSCWNNINDGTSTSYSGYPIVYNNTTYAASGTNALRFHTYSSSSTYDDQMAVLPMIDPTLYPMNTLQMSFDARQISTSYPFTLVVGVLANPTDKSSFVAIDTINVSSITYQHYELTFNEYMGSGSYIGLMAPRPATSYNQGYLDNIVVEEIPSCPKPRNLATTTVSATSIGLSWNEVGTATAWEIEYGTPGFTPGGTAGTVVQTTVSPVTLDNLTPATTYDIYVRSDCGSEYSLFSNKISVTTNCVAVDSLPYAESFDTYGTGTTVYPTCWRKINTYSSDRPYVNTTHYDGVGSLYFYAGSSGTYNIAITPEFDPNIDINTLQATFMYRASNTNDRMIVGVISNPTDASTFVPIDTVYPGSTASTWLEKTVYFNNYTGTAQHIAFKCEYTTAACYSYIDNLVIEEVPTCQKPMHVTSANATTTSIELSWDQIGQPVSWEIEYGPNGFTPGTGTTVTATTNSYTVTGLNPSSAYDFYVTADCGGGDVSSTSFVYTAATACAAIAILPYTENFDAYSTGTTSYPLCWSRINTYSSVRPYVNSTCFAGVGSLYFYGTPSTYNIAITPEFNASIPINTLQATFMYRASSVANDRLIVGVMTNPTDAGTFVPVDTVYPAGIATSWVKKEVVFSDYTGNGHYIAFYNGNPSANCYSYMDNLVIEPIPSCTKPKNLTVSGITDSSVTLNWTPTNSETSWEVVYGTHGFNPNGAEATVVAAGTHPFTVQNLNNATTYEFYVRAICDSSDYSYWSNPVTVATLCAGTVALPYAENFEGYPGTVYNNPNGVAPACWTTYSMNATYGPPHVTSSGSYHYVHSGTNCMVFTCNSAGTTAYAALPTFNQPLNTLSLNFWRAMESSSQGELTVGYVTNLADFDNSYVVVATIPSVASTAGDTITVDFTGASVPANGNICFRWFKESTYYSCCIDDINVVKSSCGCPTALTLDSITQTSAQIQFTPARATDNQWEIILLAPGDTIDPSLAIPLTTTSYEFQNLTSGIQYSAYVRTDCGDDDYSAWAGPLLFTPGVYNMGVSGWDTLYTCGSIIYDDGGPNGEHSNNVNAYLVLYPDQPGRHVQIEGTLVAESSTYDYLVIYDGVGTSNQILKTDQTSPSDTFHIPTITSTTGPLTIYFHTDNSVTYAGYEIFTACVNCIPPSPVLTNLSHNEATLDWSSFTNTRTDFEIVYGPVGFNPDTATPYVVSNVTSYTLMGLTDNTSYDFYIRSDCGDGTYSTWEHVSFTTNPLCTEPRNVTISHVTGSSALVSWSAALIGASDYTVEYTEADQNSWIPQIATDTSLFLSGLTQRTAYEVKVYSNCVAGRVDTIQKSFVTNCLAGGELSIGTGTGTSSNFPSFSTYMKSYSQQIFLASEMNGAGAITSVAFEMTAVVQQRNYKIFLMHTPLRTSATWIPADSAQLCFQGAHNFVVGWNTFDFTTPFQYNGTDNLVLIVIDENSSWVSSNKFKVHTVPYNTCHMWYSDDFNYSINSTPGDNNYNTTTVRNNVKFGSPCDSVITCIAPNMVVSAVDETTATVIWVPGHTESSWNLEYKDVSDSSWTTVPGLSGSTYTITGLNANTEYTVRMQSDCGSGDVSNWKSADFRTSCGLTSTLPFVEDFDSYGTGTAAAYPYCWTKYNTYAANPALPHCSSTSYAGAGSMYLYVATLGAYNMAITPPFDPTIPVNTLQASFMYRAQNSKDRMIVGVMSDPTDPTTFVPVDTVYPGRNASTWEDREVNFSNYTGNGQYIAFLNEYTTSSCYSYFDNLVIDLIPNCPRPKNLAITSTTSSSVTLTWTETGTATNWNVVYGPIGFDPDTVVTNIEHVNTTPTVTISDLAFGTPYEFYVQSACGGSDVSLWRGPSVGVPGSYNMHTSGWDTLYSCNAIIYDDGGLDEDYSNDVDAYLVLYPDQAGQFVQVNGTLVAERSAYDYLTFYDGVGTANQILKTNQSSSGSTYTIPTITSSTGPLTIYFHSDYIYQYAGYELFTTCVSCVSPTMTVTNIGSDEATLDWSSFTGFQTNFEIVYGTPGINPDNETPIVVSNANTYHITGLTSLTAYVAYIRTDCGDGTYTNWRSVNFNTIGCNASNACVYTLILTDGYGDGWNNGYLTVEQNGVVVDTVEAINHRLSNTLTIDTMTVTLCDSFSTSLVWHSGSYIDEVGFTLIGPDGTQLYTHTDMGTYTTYTFTTECISSGPAATDPTVATNAASSIGHTSATLSATITNPDNVTVTAKGFEWKATTGSTYMQIAGIGTGNTFTANLTGLIPNTSYTFMAFITFNETTVYGNEITFTTECNIFEGDIFATACDSYTWNGQTYTQSGNYTQHFQNIHGCDSAVTLHLTIHQSSHVESNITSCGTYTWNGQTYHQSGNYTQHFMTVNGCDSSVTTHLTISNFAATEFTAAACGNYTWNGQTYAQSGNYVQHFQTVHGCDSTVTLHLTIHNAVTHQFSVTACDSYTWNGQTYSQSGDYIQIFQTVNGCDSTVTLHLTIHNAVTQQFSETSCGSYTWTGQTYTQSGDYVQHFQTVNGCDSAVTLHLAIHNAVTSQFTETACGSYTWNGQTYSQSGDYTQHFTTVNGCDSTVTAHLTISNFAATEFTAAACEIYTWNGQTYYQSGDYVQHFQTVNGCDSTVTLHLAIHDTATYQFSETACDSYTWNDQTYTKSGDYTQHFLTAYGCDSTVTLHLTIHNAVTHQFSVTTCDSYTWNRQTYQQSGDYVQHFQTVHGCDSAVTLHLTIHNAVANQLSKTACESYIWNGQTYTQSGDYMQHLQTVHGCDSTVTLHLTIHNDVTHQFSEAACDSYTWNGQTYFQSGNYTKHFQTVHGCDSMVTLRLTIHNAVTYQFSETACESYTWNGQTYTQSGDYVQHFQSVHGCDSAVTLHLTIHNTVTSQFSETACDSYTWNGQTYSQSGDYVQHFQNVHGCDSAVTLHLTIHQSSHVEFNITSCGTYTWNGQTYHQSGNYIQRFTTVNGCDSAVTLHLTISNFAATEFTAAACENYTWNGQTYHQSGDYVQHFQTVQGCDSAVTLHLTIHNAVTHQFTETACDSYTWNGETYTQSGDYVQHFQSVHGCDSAVTLHLIIYNAVTSQFSETACDSYTWNGLTYTQSGDYVQHFQNVHGCDSAVTLHLTIHNAVTSQFTETSCGSYTWNGQTYYQNGDYTQYFTTVNGCDSTVTAHLTISDFAATEFTADACGNYTWNGLIYAQSGDYVQHFQTVNGCDSAITLHLTIHNAVTHQFTETACNSYTWNGQTYSQSGDYVQHFQTVHGCDSTVFLHLIVNHSDSTECIMTECDSYTWNDSVYTTSGDYVQHFQNVHGCDSAVTLHLTIHNAATQQISETACDSYIWNDSIYTTTGDYVQYFQTIHGCDSTVTLHLSIHNAVTYQFSETACDSYTWNDQTYHQSGDYTQHFQTVHGCDSMVTLHLTIGDFAVTEITDTACDSYTWNGQTYAQSGDYVQHLQTVHGCDSTVTLRLTIHNSATYQFTETACDSFTWNDQTYTQSGDYTQHFTTINGCDSTVTLHLTIHQGSHVESNITSCGTYTWNGQTYHQSGNYIQRFTTVNGCDSTVTVHLTISNFAATEFSAAACGNYTWNGQTYIQSGDYTQHFQTVLGCDSTVTLHLTIHNAVTSQFTETACVSYIWNGQTYTQSGDYVQHFQTVHGCDSTVTLHLTIHNAVTSQFSETSCDSYTWNGQTYTQSGDYVQHFQTVNGCDSTVTLHLTIHNAVTSQFTETACGSYTWNGQTYYQNGDYTQYFTTVNGCDSTVTVHLTIGDFAATEFTAASCGNYIWNGQTYRQSGDYVQHFQTVNGCDSAITLHLTIHNAVTLQFSETACDSYTWNGQTYSQSGDYTQHFQTVHGCDSTVMLHLTIHNAVTSQFSETACDSYTWNGQTYTQSGDYVQHFQTVNGCDSAVTLHLTINTSDHEDLHVSACDSYTWNGQTYQQSGDFVQHFTTIHGCDSAVTLHLTIYTSDHEDLHVSACDSYTWNGQTYTQSGDYVQHFQTVNGCDSTVTLHLTIHNAVTSQFSETACDSYTWNGQTYAQNGDYVQHFQTVHGCDSTVTMHLILHNTATYQFTETACDSYTWNGQTYTQSGDYTQHFQTVNGCDSTVTLHLTIHQSSHVESNITSCGTYIWNGQTYYQNGDYMQHFTTVNGCDSTVTIHLTISNFAATEFAAAACENYTWNGQTYAQSGDYVQHFQTVHSCDSTVTLHLTIHNAVTHQFSETACDSYTWNGQTYTSNGDYMQHFQSVNGCDSTVMLHLTIHNAVTSQFSETACNSYTWNGQIYSQSGDYMQHFQTVHGCDSAVTLHLTIHQNSHVESNITSCGTYIWNGQTYYQNGDYTQHFTTVNGCDSTVTVHLTISDFAATEFTAAACGNYTLNGQTYTQSGDYVQHFQTVNGCDSAVTLHLTIHNSVTNQFAETACDSYTWNGRTYTQSGDFVQQFQTVHGCDSAVTLHLTIHNAATHQFSETACDSYTWNGQTYTQSGDFVQHFQTVHGCDSAVTLNLTLHNAATHQFSETACDSYTWNGQTYTQSGNFVQHFQTVNGCDSAVTLHLTIHNSVTNQFAETACDSYTWNGRTYTQSGDFVQQFQTVHGCDSAVTLHLTLHNAATHQFSETACDSYTWNSQTYTQSGDYTQQFQTIHGCDSTVMLHLTIHNSVTNQFAETACDSYTWNGQTYTQSGDFVQHFHTVHGCDSTVTLHLTIHNAVTNQFDETACDSYTWNGQTYTQSGDFVQHFQTVHGCDSTVTLHLTIHNAATHQFTEKVCDSYTWNGQTYAQSGDYMQQFQTINGCDSTVTLHLTIYNSVTNQFAETACNNYTWNGQTYTQSGDYMQYFQTINGCDSMVTLHLTIHDAVTHQVNETACDSYTWNGQTYTQSGDYTQYFQTVNGCDSTVTLHLTVNHPVTNQFNETACDSYTWNGQTYTQSGDYTQQFQAVNGCDSTVTLHLTVNNAVTNQFNETDCDSFTWNGQTYTQSGDYTQQFQTVNGCDSTVTLHLTIHNAVTNQFNETACDSYTWNGQTYTQSGDYTQQFQAVNGCDSTVTLHLTVNNAVTNQFNETACDSYTWNGQTYTQSGDYTQQFQTVNGCDSTVTLHLTINPTDSGAITMAVEDDCYIWNGVTYCEDGDYTQVFTNQFGCDSVVTLHLTLHVGIGDHNVNNITLYPNPTRQSVQIRNSGSSIRSVTLFDASGRMLNMVKVNDHTAVIDLSGYAAGTYFLRIMTENGVVTKKVVKSE